MKNLKKISGLIIVLLLIFLIIPKTVLAANDDYKIWESKNKIDINKQWTIVFKSKVDTDTINNSNIVVADELNNTVNTDISICDDKKTITVDAPKGGYAPGKTYTLIIKNVCNEKGIKLVKPIKMCFTIKESTELCQMINNVTVKIRKVEQDVDSLKIYLTYTNNSDKEVLTGDSLTKLVYNNKQYAYDSDFNFSRYYKKDIKAPGIIEPTVSADSVVFFKPIANIDKINLVLSANYENYRFDDVTVNDMAKGQIEVTEEQQDNVLDSITKDNVTINLNKVVQDDDSLKVYLTYINNSTKEVLTGDSLAKLVANGKQYGYDSDFNFNRYYNQNVPHAQGIIEPTVKEKSLIYFNPITDTDTINLVLNAGFEDYAFNNIKINKISK
ncbi:Ig-like domain-containing protein [Clostridium thailandense]|uniref:Ig-like domain-containing protein n=1 Tax=Clostridium thailandense TaxID=2794346 RepID=UPI003989F0EC